MVTLIAFFLLAAAPVSFKLSYGNESLPFRVHLDADGVIEVSPAVRYELKAPARKLAGARRVVLARTVGGNEGGYSRLGNRTFGPPRRRPVKASY